MLANYHTHTPRCNHAKGSEREFIEKAIKEGFKVLGFSDHTPWPYASDFVSGMRMRLSQLQGYLEMLGIPFSYFYTFYQIRGKRILFILCLLCTMSAPFIGAYSWIKMLGRNGFITNFLSMLGVEIGSIYGFGGILLVQSLKLFPLVVIYMNGAFSSIDNSLMEASANLGCKGVPRLFKVVLMLTMPTILAAALLVFMRAFADFGTPAKSTAQFYRQIAICVTDGCSIRIRIWVRC